MPEYHVGCGLCGIYASTLKKNGEEWLHKSNVTNEAIKAVIGHMYWKAMDDEENGFAYAVKLVNGKYARLKLEIADECPEWAKEILEGRQNGTDQD